MKLAKCAAKKKEKQINSGNKMNIVIFIILSSLATNNPQICHSFVITSQALEYDRIPRQSE
jgi:hypothetical protein